MNAGTVRAPRTILRELYMRAAWMFHFFCPAILVRKVKKKETKKQLDVPSTEDLTRSVGYFFFDRLADLSDTSDVRGMPRRDRIFCRAVLESQEYIVRTYGHASCSWPLC